MLFLLFFLIPVLILLYFFVFKYFLQFLFLFFPSLFSCFFFLSILIFSSFLSYSYYFLPFFLIFRVTNVMITISITINCFLLLLLLLVPLSFFVVNTSGWNITVLLQPKLTKKFIFIIIMINFFIKLTASVAPSIRYGSLSFCYLPLPTFIVF